MLLLHPLITLGREFVTSPWERLLERNLHNQIKISHINLIHMVKRIISLPIAVILFTGLFILAAYSKVRKFIILPWKEPLECNSKNQIKFNLRNLYHLVKRIFRLPIVACLLVGMLIKTLALPLIMMNILLTLKEADKMLLSFSSYL